MMFVIPLKTKSGNVGHGREHWAARARRVKDERRATAWAWRQATVREWKNGRLLAPGHPYIITLVRVAPRPLDGDNLLASLKSVRDQIAGELDIDDGTDEATWWYGQERGGPREYAVMVSIEPVEVVPKEKP